MSMDSTPPTGGRSLVGRLLRGTVLELAVFFLLAVWSTWPLVCSIDRALPLGTEPAATVPLFNAWTLWWNVDRAPHALQGYWQSGIFYPSRYTFALSEAQPTLIATAPIYYSGGSIPLAYNLYLLVGLTLNGYCMARLFRVAVGDSPLKKYTGGDRAAAMLVGALAVVLPGVHWQLGVLQLTPIFGCALAVEQTWAFSIKPTWRRGLAIGACLGLVYWLCNYYGLFLGILLLVGGWLLLGWQCFRWRSWLKLAPGVALFAAMTGPIVWAQYQAKQMYGMQRAEQSIGNLSARWTDYTQTPWPQTSGLPAYDNDPKARNRQVGLGYLRTCLALIGVGVGLATPRLRRFTAFCGLMTACAVILSLGTHFSLGWFTPYLWLFHYVPGVSAIRSVYRFGILAQVFALGLIGVAILGLLRLAFAVDWETGSIKQRIARIALLATAALVAAGALFEVIPARQNLYQPPTLAQHAAWSRWLRENTPADAAIACVPFPKGRSANAYERTTEWIYLQQLHHRPMANGYSGFFPDTFRDLKEHMEHFPGSDGLSLLRQFGVRYCVVDREIAQRDVIEANPFIAGELIWRYGDDQAGVDIYEVPTTP